MRKQKQKKEKQKKHKKEEGRTGKKVEEQRNSRRSIVIGKERICEEMKEQRPRKRSQKERRERGRKKARRKISHEETPLRMIGTGSEKEEVRRKNRGRHSMTASQQASQKIRDEVSARCPPLGWDQNRTDTLVSTNLPIFKMLPFPIRSPAFHLRRYRRSLTSSLGRVQVSQRVMRSRSRRFSHTHTPTCDGDVDGDGDGRYFSLWAGRSLAQTPMTWKLCFDVDDDFHFRFDFRLRCS